MTKPHETSAPPLSRGQRQVLDYIAELSVELSELAGGAGFDDLARDLQRAGARARDRVHLARAGVGQAET